VNLYTSYFAVARKVEDAGLVPVSIALWPPRGWKGRRYPALAPRREMFGKADFAQRYLDMLAGLDPAAVLSDLEALAGGRDVALVCFERALTFCHRRVAASWLEEKLGVEVTEWGFDRGDVPDWRDLPSRPRR
jgi:uncharacterized protein (DUF488 family)